jgi:hypothetical protein|tara:strand:- start:117 stop:644 length:528 start_codon:yes stop_codon:yes gene_type:complete
MPNQILLNYVDINSITPYAKNSRINEDTVKIVAESIKAYGFQQPIVVDKNDVIVVGHTRYRASKLLELSNVPVVKFKGTLKEAREYRIADNRIQDYSEWDKDVLLNELLSLDDVAVPTGFTNAEVDELLKTGTTTYEYAIPTVFEVVVEVETEEEQESLYKNLIKEGLSCRLLSI